MAHTPGHIALLVAYVLLSAGEVQVRGAAPPATRPTQATSRPAARRMPHPGPFEKFSDGWETRRAVVKAITRDSITVRTIPGGPKEVSTTFTLRTDEKTNVLISVPVPKPANTVARGARPVRMRQGMLSEVKPGARVSIAPDDQGHAALIATVFTGDIAIVEMPPAPPPSAAMLEAASAAEAAGRPPVSRMHAYGTIVQIDEGSILLQRPQLKSAQAPPKPNETFTLGPATMICFTSYQSRPPTTAPARHEDLKVGQHVNITADMNRVAERISINVKGRLPARRPTTAPAATREAGGPH